MVADADSELDPNTWEGQIITTHGQPNSRLRLAPSCDWSNWPYHSRSAELKFAAFNLAGELSAWSEPELVTVREGCNTVGAPGGLVAVGLLGWRRRRRA